MDQKKFLTIKETSRLNLLSEYALRQMAKQKQLPGFYAGKRFYVNLDMLKEQLDQTSWENAQGE